MTLLAAIMSYKEMMGLALIAWLFYHYARYLFEEWDAKAERKRRYHRRPKATPVKYTKATPSHQNTDTYYEPTIEKTRATRN